jgi:hypothetical protein
MGSPPPTAAKERRTDAALSAASVASARVSGCIGGGDQNGSSESQQPHCSSATAPDSMHWIQSAAAANVQFG